MTDTYTLVDLQSSPYDKLETIRKELEQNLIRLEKSPSDEGLKMAVATLRNWEGYKLEQLEIQKSTEGLDIAT